MLTKANGKEGGRGWWWDSRKLLIATQ